MKTNDQQVPRHTVDVDKFLKDAAKEAERKNRIFSKQHDNEQDKPKSAAD